MNNSSTFFKRMSQLACNLFSQRFGCHSILVHVKMCICVCVCESESLHVLTLRTWRRYFTFRFDFRRFYTVLHAHRLPQRQFTSHRIALWNKLTVYLMIWWAQFSNLLFNSRRVYAAHAVWQQTNEQTFGPDRRTVKLGDDD